MCSKEKVKQFAHSICSICSIVLLRKLKIKMHVDSLESCSDRHQVSKFDHDAISLQKTRIVLSKTNFITVC